MRLVFYELLPGRARLDALGDDGEPLTLEVGLPATLWAGVAMTALDRWALDSRPIGMIMRVTRRGGRVELSDGRTRMMLELLSPVPRPCGPQPLGVGAGAGAGRRIPPMGSRLNGWAERHRERAAPRPVDGIPDIGGAASGIRARLEGWEPGSASP